MKPGLFLAVMLGLASSIPTQAQSSYQPQRLSPYEITSIQGQINSLESQMENAEKQLNSSHGTSYGQSSLQEQISNCQRQIAYLQTRLQRG